MPVAFQKSARHLRHWRCSVIAINTLLVTRSQVYKEALMRMLERDRMIRAIVPSDFVLALPPAGVNGKKPFGVLYDLSATKMSFTDYASELERRHLQAR